MRELGNVLRERRRRLGMTLEAAALKAGCGRSYLSQIETGRRNRPPSERLLRKLEAALGFNDGELVNHAALSTAPESVRGEVDAARALVAALRRDGVDALHTRGDLARLVRRIEGSDNADNVEPIPGAVRQAPVINKIAAGYPTEFTDLDYPARVADHYVPTPNVNDPDVFAARVHGDSMAPRYEQGDIVVFSPATQVRTGMDCFVRFERDAETTFKQAFFESDDRGAEVIRLHPRNPKYPDATHPRESIAALYAAISVVREIREETDR